MIDSILMLAIATTMPPAPVVTVPTPVPSPVYTPQPVYRESWSDKMWRRYKENSK